MCLAVPVRLETIDGDTGLVSLSGVKREVDISLIEGVKAGDYVLVHAGFAIEKLDREEAETNLDMLREMLGGGEQAE